MENIKCNSFATVALKGGVLGGQHKAPATLTPVKPVTRFTEDWVDLETS